MSSWYLDSWVMSSSVRPLARYSCSGSPLALVKGRTAIDGPSDCVVGDCDGVLVGSLFAVRPQGEDGDDYSKSHESPDREFY